MVWRRGRARGSLWEEGPLWACVQPSPSSPGPGLPSSYWSGSPGCQLGLKPSQTGTSSPTARPSQVGLIHSRPRALAPGQCLEGPGLWDWPVGPGEHAQPGAAGCWRRGQLPLGPGVLALLCRSELLGPTLVKPPGLCPLAAAGPGPSGGDDAACSGRVLVPTSGQHPEPRGVLAPPSEYQPGTAGCRWQQQGA